MPIEGDDVRVIGHHEHAIAGNADAAIDASRGIANEPFGSRTLIVPDLAAAAGIEGVTLVRARAIYITPSTTTGVTWSRAVFRL